MSEKPTTGRSPDLPPEHAETYRRAYDAAYRDLAREGSPDPVEEGSRYAVSGPLFAEGDAFRSERPAEPTQTLPGLALLEEASTHQADEAALRDERPAWLVPGLLALAVVLLLGAAYGVGKAVSHGVGSTDQAARAGGVTGGAGGSHEAQGTPYQGAVQALSVQHASASCQAPRSVDAAGHPIAYPAANAVDGDLTTAWRCDGDGVGEKLTLQLPAGSRVAEVGLVPGYAKTDPRSGADRYAQNDRLTKVRWVFGDGTTVTQSLDGSAKRRDLQTQRIPLVNADKVTVEILASTPGPRHTVAVSEVQVSGPAD